MTDILSDNLSLSPSESTASARWFKLADISGTGVVKPAEAVAFLSKSKGLSQETLGKAG